MALNVGELFATIDLRDRLSAGLRRAIGNLRDAAKRFDVDVGSMAKRAGAMGVQFTAAALQAATLAASLGVAAQGAVGLVAALAPAGGIVALLPGAVALAGAAFATFKIALSGVGDAFKAVMDGDPKKVAEALAGLSPAARSAALELQAVKPVLDGLKSSVQDAFFAPLQGQLTALVATLGGPLKTGMTGVSSEFGRLGAEVATFAQSHQAVYLVDQVFQTLRNTLGDIQAGTLQRLLAALGGLVDYALPAFSGLGRAVDNVANRFSNWLETAMGAGEPVLWIDGALGTFRQLGSIASDVFGILQSVFQAMNASGSNALGVIGQLLGKVNDFLSSAQGQTILVTIFQSLSQVGQALMPIVVALGGALALIAPHIANIATALGPGLAAAVSALGPALAALGPGLTVVAEMLAKAFASPELQAGLLALGQGLSAALTAVAPLLPIVGQLAGILGQVLGAALSSLSGVLGPVISALSGALAPILPQLSSAIAQVAAATAPLAAQFGTVLAQAIQVLLPPLLQIAMSLLPPTLELVKSLAPLLGDLAGMFGGVLKSVLPLLPPLIQIATATLPLMISIVSALAKLLTGDFKGALDTIVNAVLNFGNTMISAGQALLTGLWNGFVSAKNWFRDNILGFFKDILPDWVRDALGIHSPSRVFAAMGRMLPAGMAAGIDQASSLVRKSLDRMSSMAAGTSVPDIGVPGVNVPDRLAGGGVLSRAVVNVTNHYPVAEATSVSVNRGLQYAGALGVI
ncbi:phage tail protein [Sphaerisporangium viridialbum]|uniref:phage tail protein n=1 Tax=Sphaerisporangium viridialbum TaxID=46189 RepID=UPI003C764A76